MSLRPRDNPPPLVVAASLGAVEGLLLIGYAVLEAAHTSADRVAVGVTTALFFAAYGGSLLLCAGGLVRRRSWARSPMVLAQLIQLGVAWSFVGGSTTPVSVVVAVIAIVVLVGVLHPASIDALAGSSEDR